MQERPSPIGFWKYPVAGERNHERWIDPVLARGTTPTTPKTAIDFLNFKHTVAATKNFGGEAAWTDNRYKLIVSGKGAQLYDLSTDPKETKDIAKQNSARVQAMTAQLHAWQASVERSLSGGDYR
jgi:hypothetical protein